MHQVLAMMMATLCALGAGGAGAGGTGDAPWPPVPVDDPDPVVVEVPAGWPEVEKTEAWRWVTVQGDTRACALRHGLDYRYEAPWPEGTPPLEWQPLFEAPSWPAPVPSLVTACFTRALDLSDRPPDRRGLAKALAR